MPTKKLLAALSFLRLRNAEVIQFLSQLLVLLTAADLPALLAESIQKLQRTQAELDALHKTDPGSLITDELVEIDEDRDDLYKGLAAHCRNLLRHNDEAVLADAKALTHVLGVYGDADTLTEQGYAAESTDIDSVLADLARPELAAAVARTGATLWAEALKAANDLFKKRFLDRDEEKLKKEFAYTMIRKRKESAEAYDEVLRKINALVETGSEEALRDLVGKIDTLTENYRQTVRQRKGAAKAKKAKEAPSA